MTLDDAIQTANEIGTDHGNNAGSWVDIDNNNAGQLLDMFNDGDPAVYDYVPAPDFSGQWADAYSLNDLYSETGINDLDASGDEREDMEFKVISAYEIAFSEAVESTVTNRCNYYLS